MTDIEKKDIEKLGYAIEQFPCPSCEKKNLAYIAKMDRCFCLTEGCGFKTKEKQ